MRLLFAPLGIIYMNHFTGYHCCICLRKSQLTSFVVSSLSVCPLDVCFSNHQNPWLSLPCTILMTPELISLLQTSPISTTCGSCQKYFFLGSSISTSSPAYQKLNSSPFALCMVFLENLFDQKIIVARIYLFKTKKALQITFILDILTHYPLLYLITDNAL